MDSDTLIVLAVVVFGGAIVWYVLQNKNTATIIAPPCNIGGSYQGFGLQTSCAEAEKIAGSVVNSVTSGKVLNYVPGLVVARTIGETTYGGAKTIAKTVVVAPAKAVWHAVTSVF